MQISKLEINGFKDQHIILDLTGRDIVRASNIGGKTTVKEALDFCATGKLSTPGFKREDLIDYAPGGRFDVTVTTDTGLKITRWFKVKKGQKGIPESAYETVSAFSNTAIRRASSVAKVVVAPATATAAALA